MLVSFCDHTGSVDGVVLAGSVAEDILQCSVSLCVRLCTCVCMSHGRWGREDLG